MNNPKFEVRQSAPECQLHETGTASSYGILSKAVQSLSDRKLKALEDDLSFYAQTGLIGTHMSWLLVLLRGNATTKTELRTLAI